MLTHTIRLVSRVTTLLKQLGSYHDTIAFSLSCLQLKGIRNDPRSCPISRYLSRELQVPHVFINRGYRKEELILIDIGERPQPCLTLTVFSKGLLEFTKRFDEGIYSGLEQRGVFQPL